MDIIIEDGLSVVQQRGCGQYTLRIYEFLHSIDNINVSLERKLFLEKIKNNAIRRILYIIWLNTFFVLQLLFKQKKTICIFSAVVTPIIKLPNIEYISVLHDIRSKIYPELSSWIQNLHINFANWSAINFSDKLITVSETSKEDICKIYNVDPKKVYIAYNTSSITSVVYDEKESVLKQYNLEKENYLLFVGGLDKNKNVNLIIDSFNEINLKYKNLKLVIAGKNGNSDIIISNDNIILTGFITNEDIKVLYKNALIYLFPSSYEGFGIPIIDAQSMKCPVICSDIKVFHEVGRDSVIYSELNKNEFTKNIENVINQSSLREKLINKGIQNIERFTKDIVKNQILEILSK